MTGTAYSKPLWCMLMLVAVLITGLLAGCGKPAESPPAAPPVVQAPPVPPAPTTPAAPSNYNKPAAAPSETGKPQTAADAKNMTDLEKKHVPQFALPKDIKSGQPLPVTVNVGQVAHPMVATHYIEWVELYLDGKLVKKVVLKPGDKPMGTFEITPNAGAHKLMAHIFCNLHGLWANTMDITAK